MLGFKTSQEESIKKKNLKSHLEERVSGRLTGSKTIPTITTQAQPISPERRAPKIKKLIRVVHRQLARHEIRHKKRLEYAQKAKILKHADTQNTNMLNLADTQNTKRLNHADTHLKKIEKLLRRLSKQVNPLVCQKSKRCQFQKIYERIDEKKEEKKEEKTEEKSKESTWIYKTEIKGKELVKKESLVSDEALFREIKICLIIMGTQPELNLINISAIQYEPRKRSSITMEYGDSLHSYHQYRRDKKLIWTTEELCNLIYQVIQQMEALRTLGIYHRDIKPTNIILCGDEKIVKLIDFNLSEIFPGGSEHCVYGAGTENFWSEDNKLAFKERKKRRIDLWKADIYSLTKTITYITEWCKDEKSLEQIRFVLDLLNTNGLGFLNLETHPNFLNNETFITYFECRRKEPVAGAIISTERILDVIDT
jgi:hypothetical protein